MGIPAAVFLKHIGKSLAIGLICGLVLTAFADGTFASEGGDGGGGGSEDMFSDRTSTKRYKKRYNKPFERKLRGLRDYLGSIKSARPNPKWKKTKKVKRKKKKKIRRVKRVRRAPVRAPRSVRVAPRTPSPSRARPAVRVVPPAGPAVGPRRGAAAGAPAPEGRADISPGRFDTPASPRRVIPARVRPHPVTTMVTVKPPGPPAPPRIAPPTTPPVALPQPAPAPAPASRPVPSISAPTTPWRPPVVRREDTELATRMRSALGTISQLSGPLADGSAAVVGAVGTPGFVGAGTNIEGLGTLISIASISTATVDTAFSDNAQEYSENYDRQLRTTVGAVASAVTGAVFAAPAAAGLVGLAGVISAPALAVGIAAGAVVGIGGAFAGGIISTALYDRFASAGVKEASVRNYQNNIGGFTSLRQSLGF